VKKVDFKLEAIHKSIEFLKNLSVSPDSINGLLDLKQTAPISQKVKLDNIVLRPQISLLEVIETIPQAKEHFASFSEHQAEIIEETEILMKYERYIEKEREIADRLSRVEDMPLKPDFNYQALPSLSFEAREKLSKIRPSTLGQASRINGVSPADISVLVVFLSK
jgi:tRNA uridine 5-carboxymethylaminomethyl modification enzyme